MDSTVGIMIAKGDSKRLPKKNKREISGRKMFHWNLLKMIEMFGDDVYISTDDETIIEEARQLGVNPIRRPKRLMGHEVPSVPIFQHIVQSIEKKPDNIVHTQANSPTCPLDVIKLSAECINCPTSQELITVYPDSHDVNSSVWAFSYGKLMNYGDYRELNADVLITDESTDIHYEEDLEIARKNFSTPNFVG